MNLFYGECIEVWGKVVMMWDVGGSEVCDVGDDFFLCLVVYWKCQYIGNFVGWIVWMFSFDMKLLSRMWLKELCCVLMWNGLIECWLFCFDFVKGLVCKFESDVV